MRNWLNVQVKIENGCNFELVFLWSVWWHLNSCECLCGGVCLRESIFKGASYVDRVTAIKDEFFQCPNPQM